MTAKHGFAAYPPKAEHIDILGYMQEDSGIFHSRDIGRSFELDGKVYLLFGDTFCKNGRGDFLGLTNNTIAVVDDRDRPLRTRCIAVEWDGLVKPFLPYLPGKEWPPLDQNERVVLWAFGGVAEMRDGSGLLWYQKSIDHGGGNLDYVGTGVARVARSNYYLEQQPLVVPGHPKWSESPDEGPVAHRLPVEPHRHHHILFSPEEPRMGTFSAIAHEDHFYVFGDRPDGDIIVARGRRAWDGSWAAEREAYFFWDGDEWVPDWREAAVVIEGMQQGAIVRSKLFGEDRPFLFVGTSKWADSLVYVGASAKLQGPWTIEPVCQAEGINERGKWIYCIYPQLWASDEEKAELMVTWSEQWPGGVVAAKIKLAAVKDGDVES